MAIYSKIQNSQGTDTVKLLWKDFFFNWQIFFSFPQMQQFLNFSWQAPPRKQEQFHEPYATIFPLVIHHLQGHHIIDLEVSRSI